jgi:NadR type nicotinamide-nucleotide adenylyltransferase
MQCKKIVAIGPESTGKSTLCTQLASHFKTTWVPEYAREFLLKHGTDYKYEDLYTIATGQLESEKNIELGLEPADSNPPLLFVDTDLHVIKVWSEFVFGKCDNRILTGIANSDRDLYLLCNTDLPWVKDELREYPDLETREILYHYYKETMINQPVRWVEIKGTDEERLQTAITAVNKLF